ncbi:MAG TPA: glycosyltransferase family 4 protein [Candidatus Paceibacterota bacterium]|nr:glycosyltransferase family 4 protein [Candidatus Paceibacterota bacterium]
MKVLLLTNSLDPKDGGWARYSLELARELEREGVEVEIVTESTGNKAQDSLAEGVRMHTGLHMRPDAHPRRILNILHDYFFVRRLASTADVVHALVEHHVFTVSLLGKPYYMTAHGTYALRLLRSTWFGAWMRLALTRANGILFGSAFTQEKVLEKVPGLTNTIFIPNGVDTNVFTPSLNRTSSQQFLTTGALKSRKGQDLVVRALARIHSDFPEATYAIVGDQRGSFTQHVHDLVSELRLSSHVTFVPSVDTQELIRRYQGAIAFILLSRTDGAGSFEGFPLSLLEAAACGIPIIGSRGCGAEHLITDGENGFLFDEEDVEGLAGAMALLLKNRDLATAMGRAARLSAERLSWRTHASRVIAVYNQGTT